jgi:predicted RNA methylase
MTDDTFAEIKNRQRQMWSSFAPTVILTTPVAAHLVKFAGVRSGESVLDAACGTGVVAITAARTPAARDHATSARRTVNRLSCGQASGDC